MNRYTVEVDGFNQSPGPIDRYPLLGDIARPSDPYVARLRGRPLNQPLSLATTGFVVGADSTAETVAYLVTPAGERIGPHVLKAGTRCVVPTAAIDVVACYKAGSLHIDTTGIVLESLPSSVVVGVAHTVAMNQVSSDPTATIYVDPVRVGFSADLVGCAVFVDPAIDTRRFARLLLAAGEPDGSGGVINITPIVDHISRTLYPATIHHDAILCILASPEIGQTLPATLSATLIASCRRLHEV